MTVDRLTVVAVLVSVTLAPEITAPVGSVIVPLTVPRLVWANVAIDRMKNTSVKNAALIFMFTPSRLQKIVVCLLGAQSNVIEETSGIYLRNNYSILIRPAA